MKTYKYKEFKKILNKNGFQLDRISGDHFIYKSKNERLHISIPLRGNDIKPFYTAKLIKRFNLVV